MALAVKNMPANAGDIRDVDSIPGSGRSPGGGHGSPLQYSYLEKPMDRGAWQATVHRVAQCQTRLKRLSTYACIADYKVVAVGFYSRHIYCFKIFLFVLFFILQRRHSMLSYYLPVIANEEVFPVSGLDGHHFIRVTFKHLLYRLHFFMAPDANFYTGISIRYKVLNRCKYKIRKKTD